MSNKHCIIQVCQNPLGFYAICLGCGKALGTHEEKYADLAGAPFEAYFCKKCARELENE